MLLDYLLTSVAFFREELAEYACHWIFVSIREFFNGLPTPQALELFDVLTDSFGFVWTPKQRMVIVVDSFVIDECHFAREHPVLFEIWSQLFARNCTISTQILVLV